MSRIKPQPSKKSVRPHGRALTWLTVAVVSGLVGSYLVFFGHAQTAPVSGQKATTSTPSSFWNGSVGAGRAAYNGNIYILNLLGSYSSTNPVYYAHANDDGSLGAWVATTGLPVVAGESYKNKSAVAANGYLYVIDCDHVAYAPINPDGSLGAWHVSANGAGQCNGSNGDGNIALAYNGIVYYAVSDHKSPPSTTFYYARVTGNGSLSNWATTASPPGEPNEADPPYAIANGVIYAAGLRVLNQSYPSGYTQATYFSRINGDGSLGPWQTTAAIPGSLHPNYLQGVFATSQYLYVSASTVGNTAQTMYFAPINADGTIGPWQSTPAIHYTFAPVTANGHVYSFGWETQNDTSVYSAAVAGSTDQTGPAATKSGGGSGGSGQSAGGHGAGAGTSGGTAAGGSSSAVTKSPTTAPTTTASSQGTTVKPPPNPPSPFYDGTQYAAGSAADVTLTNTAAKQRNAKRWLSGLSAAVVILAAAGMFAWWRRRRSRSAVTTKGRKG